MDLYVFEGQYMKFGPQNEVTCSKFSGTGQAPHFSFIIQSQRGVLMWTIGYLQSDNPSVDDEAETSKWKLHFKFDSPRSRSKSKIKSNMEEIKEIDQKGHQTWSKNMTAAIGAPPMQKKISSNQNISDFSVGRLAHFNSLHELAANNDLDFSFQEGTNQVPYLKAESTSAVRQQLLRLVSPKIDKLRMCRDSLRGECLQLKRQLIKFQGFKRVFFDHLAKKISMHVSASTQSAKRECDRLNQLLQTQARDLEHSQLARAYFQEENSKLELAAIQKEQTIDNLRSEVKRLKLEVTRLQEENEQYFNQTTSLQANIERLTQSAHQNQLLREELDKTKEQVKQLQNKMGDGLQEAKAFERDILQYRKEIEAKIKQGWSQFKGVCDHLLPLGEKIREGFSQLEASSRNRSQLVFLRSKAEQKIGALLAFQASNYIQLSQLERDDARYKLYSLLNLMAEIKTSVFDQIQQSHGLLDYEKKCGQNMANLIQVCNRSLENEQDCDRHASYSTYISRKTERKSYTRQMSQFFPNQSLASTQTAQSQTYPTLNNSCSETTLGSREPTWTHQMQKMGKMGKIQQRLNNLRRQIRQNLHKIT